VFSEHFVVSVMYFAPPVRRLHQTFRPEDVIFDIGLPVLTPFTGGASNCPLASDPSTAEGTPSKSLEIRIADLA
jgi:hypothetical protein